MQIMGLNKFRTCIECNQCLTREDSIFRILVNEDLIELQNSKNHLVYSYGELVFKEGQYPSGFFIINKGKIKISKFGNEGREQIVRFAKAGDIIGYRALLSEEKYSCSASAISETHLCFLSREFIYNQIRSNPDFAFGLLKLLADDLRLAEEKSLNLAQKTVRERVAESILLLQDIYGFEKDHSTINITLKREEIAGIAGTVRETVTRFLHEFSESRYIELTGKKIKILDLQKLIQTANL